MKRGLATALLLVVALAATGVYAQTGSGQVGGTVQDSSAALIPGVTITLTNNATGLTTSQVTNEAGVYNFGSVPAGTYSVTAALPGFKTAVTNGVQVSLAPVRVNITLQIGEVQSRVEVTAAADSVLAETSASVGVVLPERRVVDLPLLGQNVLDLLTVLPGFRENPTQDELSTVGGLNLDYVNTTINGLSTVSSRDSASFWGRQVMTTNVINPDLVGEIRLILSPVDAELGRGNSQIQIQTRSGTNRYTGSVVWNVQNTALNADTWANKRLANPAAPEWFNLNQITASYGGPIIRNKTFFYALYDKQLVNRRATVTTPVLTDTARQGIWRYWGGWNPGPALAPQPTTFVASTAQPTGTAPSVDAVGNPIAPQFSPFGGAYSTYANAGLFCFSVYGNMKVNEASGSLVPVNPASDCPGGTFVNNATPWDPLRTTLDSTGHIMKILRLMPRANFFESTATNGNPDGLNTAQFRWLQARKGSSATNAAIGVVETTGDFNNRDQFNVKIDHNLSSNHRFSVSWTYEKSAGEASLAAWDGVLNGNSSRRPQFVTVNATSTLSPRLVNEGRFGLNYSSEFASPAWANIDHTDIRDQAQQFILYGSANPNNGRLYPVQYNPGTNWNGFYNFGSFDFANYSPLYNFADTVRWTSGKHSFSFGGEYRRPSTVGYNNSAYIQANPGNAGGNLTPLFFVNSNVTNGAASLPGFLATSRGLAGTLLSTLYGAINAPNTGYWIDGQSDLLQGRWQDVTTAQDRFTSNDPYGHQNRGQIQNEWSFFAKDDYKLTRRLTLNLGVRFDFTGSPYLTEGLTNRIEGDGIGLFGAGRAPGVDPFSTWLTPGNLFLTGYGSTATNPLACVAGAANPNGLPNSTCDPNLMSKVIFVGPGTDNPNETLVPQKGRFSPAIGLSWQVPWFGESTTIRGGFQRTYGQAGSAFSGGLLSGPGGSSTTAANINDARWQAIFATRAANLTDLPIAVPTAPDRLPEQRFLRVGSRSFNANYAHYAPDYSLPYTDNITLTVQHSLRRNMSIEVRAVNTLARNQNGRAGGANSAGSYDLNTVNVYHNPELFEALEVTRAGGDHPLFDQMLMGLNVVNVANSGYGTIGTCVTQPAGTVDPRLGQGGCGSNQILQRGSAHLRRSQTFAANLANGNYAAVASSLLTLNPVGAQGLPIDPQTGLTVQTNLRALRNGCDRIANGLLNGLTDPNSGQFIGPRCFPENYLVANPQFASALYEENVGYSDYNAVEFQYTLRPTQGLSLMATYSYSKLMAQPGNGFTDPARPALDYGKSAQSAGSDFRSNGTWELPLGPNKLLFPNSSGWVARALERWQLSFIYNWSAGAPRTFLTAANMLYANARPNIVGPWQTPEGEVRWEGQNGSFLRDDYDTYQDPQCQNVVTTLDGLRTNCSLRGLALVVPQGTAGAIPLTGGTFGIPLLENPRPGQQGNLGSSTMNTHGRWSLDANIAKAFQLSESKSVQLRIDARNILNHPTPADPVGFTNGGSSLNDNFGQITNKTGSRRFQGQVRISF